MTALALPSKSELKNAVAELTSETPQRKKAELTLLGGAFGGFGGVLLARFGLPFLLSVGAPLAALGIIAVLATVEKQRKSKEGPAEGLTPRTPLMLLHPGVN